MLQISSQQFGVFEQTAKQSFINRLDFWLCSDIPTFAHKKQTARTALIEKCCSIADQAEVVIEKDFAIMVHMLVHIEHELDRFVARPDVQEMFACEVENVGAKLRATFELIDIHLAEVG